MMTSNRIDGSIAIGRRSFLKSGAALLPGAGFSGLVFGQGLVTVGFQCSWVKSINYGGFFAAIENGYYKAEGIQAELVAGGPGIDTVANVAAGKSAMGDRPSGALIIALDRGIPIKIIGSIYQKSPGSLFSPINKPIRSFKELAGKTIAVPASARPLILLMLKEAGIDAKTVNMVPVSTDPGSLATGQVDAYYGYSTNQGMILRMRGFNIHVMNFTDAGAPNLVGAIYAREDFLRDNRDAMVRWFRASLRGCEWAMANPEKTADLMINKYGSPGFDYAQQLNEMKESVEFFRGPGAKNPLLWIDAGLIQAEIEQMRAAGLVKSALKAADFCDTQYIAAAHRKA